MTADYGDRLCEYTLRLSGGTVTILAPEEVSGIEAEILPDGVTLRYKDAEVFSGSVTASGLSPVMALPLIVNEWKSGTVSAAWTEDGFLVVEYRVSDTVKLRAAFDASTLEPVSAMLTENGGRVVSAEFEKR